jgi:hypothetical protein
MLGKLSLTFVAAGAAWLLTGAASAQINVQWVTFTKQPSKLAVAPLSLSDADTQVLMRTGDLDKDGWDDVVAMRKQASSQLGKKAAFLLMNENGVLTDRTAQYASASDVVGDMGFLTPTNTRESAIADLNGDTWLDVITSPTLSDGATKAISHPRVYVNLGDDVNGNWLGLRFEDARVDQLMTVGGLAVAPRFCGMAVGDFTGDGAIDVYYVDYDGTETGISEPSSWDLNDRFLVNDGNGFFNDESSARFTTTQLLSSFGADADAEDLNNDGILDILKDTTLGSPTAIRALYNDPAIVGNFKATGTQDLGSGAPYSVEGGNLNNDGIVDVAMADDGSDRYRFGTGFDALNKVIWGPLKTYSFVTGGDDGFGHSTYIVDIDGNGWDDVLITDVDGDFPGCSRRMHIYHNLGSVPGDMNLVLKEESEFANGGTGTGWKGVVGTTAADLKGTYDVVFNDFDHDGDKDMIIGSCTGAVYYQSEINPITEVCQTDVGFGGPGSMVLSMCGDDLTEAGSTSTLQLTDALPSQPMYLPLSLSSTPVPFKGGTLVPFPTLLIVFLATDGSGEFAAPVSGGAGPSLHVFMQALVKNGSMWELSNGLDVLLGT